jgi:hypothetical protein
MRGVSEKALDWGLHPPAVGALMPSQLYNHCRQFSTTSRLRSAFFFHSIFGGPSISMLIQGEITSMTAWDRNWGSIDHGPIRNTQGVL